MRLRQLFDADTWSFTYLLADEASGQGLLIDPVRGQLERDLQLVRELDLTLRYAIDTHVHADHVTSLGLLRERTGCETVASALGPESADLRLPHGAQLRLGAIDLGVIATPGHTDDSISLLCGEHVFTGDALLVRGNGRTDFQNGDPGALYDSITQRLFALPDATRVHPAHDYRGHTESTIGEEKLWNPRLAGHDRDEFIAIMQSLGLAPPKLIQEAVPANRELGLGMSAERGSGRFPEWDPDRAAAQRENVRVIDVREPHEFGGELGHIPGSESLPMRRFPDAAHTWERDAPLLVVCRSGRRSREVCELLADLGFTQLANLNGGMLEYRTRGHDVAR